MQRKATLPIFSAAAHKTQLEFGPAIQSNPNNKKNCLHLHRGAREEGRDGGGKKREPESRLRLTSAQEPCRASCQDWPKSAKVCTFLCATIISPAIFSRNGFPDVGKALVVLLLILCGHHSYMPRLPAIYIYICILSN